MLPYTGTYAALGTAITNGFKLAIEENGGKLGGREIEYFTVDDESDPAKAPDNANKLIKRDKVDVLVGTVHSGVALAMAKVARDNNTLLIIPNAGADDDHRAAVRGQHLPHVVLELAAGHRDGQGDGRAEEEDGGHDHLEVRGRRRVGRRLQGGVRGGRRQGGQGAVAAVPAGRVPGAA